MEDRNIYRQWVKCGELVPFNVVLRETDLQIYAVRDLSREALKSSARARDQIESYISAHPDFAVTLEPCDVIKAQPVVQAMARAGKAAGVGPMAAVAGAVAQFVGESLVKNSPEIIVENGGDLYIDVHRDIRVGLFAGTSPFTGKLGLEIKGKDTPLGICTSSGTVGHSMSFGRADAVTVICRSAAVADAYATALCNMVKSAKDIEPVIARARKSPEIQGILIVVGDKLGTWGNVRLV